MKIELSNNAETIHSVMIDGFMEYANDEIPSSALQETVETVEKDLQSGAFAAVCKMGGDEVACVRFTVKGESLYFYRLAVRRCMRGKGIAKSLLQFVESFAQQLGLPSIQCKVRLEVPGNIALYEGLGYVIYEKELSVRKDGEKIPVVLMCKNI